MATIQQIDGRPVFEHLRDDGRRCRCPGCGDVVSPFLTIVAEHLPLDLNCEWGWQCYECGYTDVQSAWDFFFIQQDDYEYRVFPPPPVELVFGETEAAAGPLQRELF